MDLPTYTSIWRIEKRLYKLYDFRLPMPLPIGQITVFTAIAVPYVVLLEVLGLPFNHTLIWLYILPPGVFTWLATRPVLESKRLPELVKSQVRYLAEPRAWCRMAPSSERDVIVVTGRVWRPARASRRQSHEAAWPAAGQRRPALQRPPARRRVAEERPAAQSPAPGRRLIPARRRAGAPVPPVVAPPAYAGHPIRVASAPGRLASGPGGPPSAWAPAPVASRSPARHERAAPVGQGPASPAVVRQPRHGPAPRRCEPAAVGPAVGPAAIEPAIIEPAAIEPATIEPAAIEPAIIEPAAIEPAIIEPAAAEPDRLEREPIAPSLDSPTAAEHGEPAAVTPIRPLITVVGAGPARAVPPAVERALAGPSARRGDARAGRVTVVPGGHRPGTPDQGQRDRARAQLPIGWPVRIVVLGCTVGAGQTITTLLTGEMLASMRADDVAVLDLNPGVASLARRAIGSTSCSLTLRPLPCRACWCSLISWSWSPRPVRQRPAPSR